MAVQPKVIRYALELFIAQVEGAIKRNGVPKIEDCPNPSECNISVSDGIPICIACKREIFAEARFKVQP